MRINNYSNCNKSFGIRLNQNIVKDIHKSTKELIKEYGKNSPQVKEFSKDVYDMTELFPNHELITDFYSDNYCTVYMRPENSAMISHKLCDITLNNNESIIYSPTNVKRIVSALKEIK